MVDNPRALVYGGTGRLGPGLIQSIKDKYRVTTFGRTAPSANADMSGHISCDLCDPESIEQSLDKLQWEGPSEKGSLGVLFMATGGIAVGRAGRGSIGAEFDVAVEGLNMIVNGVTRRAQEGRRISLVFVSSAIVSTFSPGGLSYGLGKAAGEYFCEYMAYNSPTAEWRFNAIRIGHASRDPQLFGAVGHLVSFLLGDDSLGISGQVFPAYSPSNIAMQP